MLPIGSVWRQDDGYLCKIVGHDDKGWPYVRHYSTGCTTWNVNPAWFETWEHVKTIEVAAKREP